MRTIEPLMGRRGAAVTAMALTLACGACSLLLDRNATQCQTDGDCAGFGGHPYCRSGACVSSGMGPADCFYGTPTRAQDFLNQCSAAQCLAFDNCDHVGACGAAVDASLVPPPDGGAGSSNGALSSQADGGALPSCVDPTAGRAQAVVMTGSSNFPPLLAKLAPLIVSAGYTPVFQITSSCAGAKAVFSADPSAHVITDPAPGSSAKYATYFKADGTSVPCLLGQDGMPVDIGESDVFASTCDPSFVPDERVGEYLGPIQAMVFVVPGKSHQVAISAEAARAVFGMGASGNVTPWTNPALYFVRNASTGTQQMIARAIGVPPSSFWGIDRSSASNVDALLRVIADPTLAEQAIGIISSDYYDDDRANLKALAFKASGQECAYLPDSSEFKKDKINVRDGHYPIWGPIHFFTAVANGVPISPAGQALASAASVPNLQKPFLDAIIGAGLIPSCAMRVSRTTELGPLSAYAPPFECGCYFEATLNGEPSPECTPCATASDCTTSARPACNLGYCESQ